MQPEHSCPSDKSNRQQEKMIGCQRQSSRPQIRVFLDRDFDTQKQEISLQRLGFEIRRAVRQDMGVIEASFKRHVGHDAFAELERAIEKELPNVHVALVGGQVVAYAAHTTIRDELGYFGPLGTVHEARGLGLGQILLYRCMADLQTAGHRTALIHWAGSDAFFKRLFNCRFDRLSQ